MKTLIGSVIVGLLFLGCMGCTRGVGESSAAAKDGKPKIDTSTPEGIAAAEREANILISADNMHGLRHFVTGFIVGGINSNRQPSDINASLVDILDKNRASVPFCALANYSREELAQTVDSCELLFYKDWYLELMRQEREANDTKVR